MIFHLQVYLAGLEVNFHPWEGGTVGGWGRTPVTDNIPLWMGDGSPFLETISSLGFFGSADEKWGTLGTFWFCQLETGGLRDFLVLLTRNGGSWDFLVLPTRNGGPWDILVLLPRSGDIWVLRTT